MALGEHGKTWNKWTKEESKVEILLTLREVWSLEFRVYNQ